MLYLSTRCHDFRPPPVIPLLRPSELEVIQDHAKRHSYEIVQVFQEEGVSGAKDENDRPTFQSMMTEILRDGVRTVIIEGLDRLAREYRVQETLLIYLASKGVDLISARTEENITEAVKVDPMRKALVQIQGIFAELEKNMLVVKLKKARERVKRQHGKCEGAKRYGEDSEEEQTIIRRIRAMRRRRRGGYKEMTYQAIADRLNNDGIRTKRGRYWTPTHIYRILNLHRQKS